MTNRNDAKELTPIQAAVFQNRRIRKLNIIFRDAFGQPIGKFRLEEKHAGYGGAFTLAAMMDALDLTGIYSATLPILDERAPYRIDIQLDQSTRMDRKGIKVMDTPVGDDAATVDAS